MIPTSEATVNVGTIDLKPRNAQLIKENECLRERNEQMEYEIKRLTQQLDVFSSVHNTGEV